MRKVVVGAKGKGRAKEAAGTKEEDLKRCGGVVFLRARLAVRA